MLRDIIFEDLKKVIKKLNLKIEKKYNVEVPNKKFGDFSSNIAMVNAKSNNKSPMELAELIASEMQRKKNYKSVEVVKPGFLNFTLANFIYHNALNEIMESDDFGASEYGKGKKVLLEFVSANPTGPLNVVSARAAAFGDTLYRIMNKVGFKATREFYINDAGNQVDILAESIDLRYRELHGEKIGEFPTEAYNGDYVKELAAMLTSADGIKLSHISEKERLKRIKEFGLEMIKDMQRESLENFGVDFDSWVSEKNLRKQGFVEDVLSYLTEADCTYEKENAIWFASSKFGDEKDRVLMKSDGEITYFVPDIAYHMTKYQREYDYIIDVLGPDHHGYVPRLRAAISALGLDQNKLEIIFLQQVNLFEDGEKIKMSKRLGKLVTMSELVQEVGRDAARYFFIDKKPNAHLNFDMNLAKKTTNENPVFYIQYAHARISKVIANAKKEKLTIDKFDLKNLTKLKSPDEFTLIKKLMEFPEVLIRAAETREPHQLANFTFELATLVNRYYQNIPVIQKRYKELTQARLYLLHAVKKVLATSLGLMGISAPEKMQKAKEKK